MQENVHVIIYEMEAKGGVWRGREEEREGEDGGAERR